MLVAAVTQVLAYTENVNGIEWTYHVENGAAIVCDRELRNDGFGDYYAAVSAVPEDTAGAVKVPTRLGGFLHVRKGQVHNAGVRDVCRRPASEGCSGIILRIGRFGRPNVG